MLGQEDCSKFMMILDYKKTTTTTNQQQQQQTQKLFLAFGTLFLLLSSWIYI